MGEGFVKLYEDILDSSVWCLDGDTRLVWVTMLAMANKDGLVHAAVPGIANRARVSLEATRKAIEIFQAPDPDSRSQEHEGRRIERRGRDWFIFNYGAHRERGRQDAIKANKRKWWNENRGKGTPLDIKLDETRQPSNETRPIQKQKQMQKANAEANNDPSVPSGSPPKQKGVTEKGDSGSLVATETVTPRKITKAKKNQAKSAEMWLAYKASYLMRYRVEPTANAKVNTHMCKVIDRIGAEDAPGVAAWYVMSNNGYYVARGHSMGILEADCEKVHAEWKTGRHGTQTEAREGDKMQQMSDSWQRGLKKCEDYDES